MVVDKMQIRAVVPELEHKLAKFFHMDYTMGKVLQRMSGSGYRFGNGSESVPYPIFYDRDILMRLFFLGTK